MPAKKRNLAAVSEPKKRNNTGARARGVAMQRMIESYPEAWRDFLREEREKLGLSAETGRVTRVQKFIAEMKAEGVEDSAIERALVAAGFKVKQ